MTQFTKKQQAEHCRELASFLQSLPKGGKYQHSIFVADPEGKGECGTAACALGWAAVKGIGGLRTDRNSWGGSTAPYLPGKHDDPVNAGNAVFGDGAYSRIFSTIRPNRSGCERDQDMNARKVSISRLYAQADMLDPPSDEVQ